MLIGRSRPWAGAAVPAERRAARSDGGLPGAMGVYGAAVPVPLMVTAVDVYSSWLELAVR